MLNLLKFEPDPFPEDWHPALGICAIDDDRKTYCHAALPSDEFCLVAIAAGVVIFLPIVGVEGGLPLVPIKWALKHSRTHRKTLSRIDALLRRVAKTPHAKVKISQALDLFGFGMGEN